jgi:transcriptional regulator with XRE-family HTH domain
MSKPLPQFVAERVRAELGIQQISGAELARRMNVSQAYVWRRLNGETPFDVAELASLAELLGVPVTRFLPVDIEAAAS